MKDSQTHRLKELEKKAKALERIAEQKQIKLDYLEKMTEIAKEFYDIDIKNLPNTPPTGDSKPTDKN